MTFEPLRPTRISTVRDERGWFKFIVWTMAGVPSQSSVAFETEAKAQEFGERVLANKIRKYERG